MATLDEIDPEEFMPGIDHDPSQIPNRKLDKEENR